MLPSPKNETGSGAVVVVGGGMGGDGSKQLLRTH